MTYLTCECSWAGDSSELVCLTDNLNDKDFSYCPYCGKKDCFDEEEENDE